MELKIKNGIGIMEGFANIVNGKVENGKLIIPKQYGKGYIRLLLWANFKNDGTGLRVKKRFAREKKSTSKQ